MSRKAKKTTGAKNKAIKKTLKITAFALFGIFMTIFAVLSAAIWVLVPERFTPIVEKLASDNLNADVTLDRAELTLWKNFPRLKVEVTNLEIVSKALDILPAEVKDSLPAGADRLMGVGYFTGSLNLLRIIGGKIALSDVLIDRPRINIVQVNDTLSNLSIFPQSEPSDKKSSIPDISINHFAITNAAPFTFKSIPDTLDVAIDLRTVDLADKSDPLYALTIDTRVRNKQLDDLSFKSLPIHINGGARWSGSDPYNFGLDDLRIAIDDIAFHITTDINFEEALAINSFNFFSEPIKVAYLLTHLPKPYAEQLAGVDTDMTLSLNAALTKPWVLGDSLHLPYVRATLAIPQCHFFFNDIHFDKFDALVNVDVNGDDPDCSVIDVDHLTINGTALDIDLKCRASELLCDPRIDGSFSGTVDFSKLPKMLFDKIDGRMQGTMDANTRFCLRRSNLNTNTFHKMFVDGDITLSNTRFTSSDTLTDIYARHAVLDFGSTRSLTAGNITVDSVLTIKLDVDTFSFALPDCCGELRRLTAALGTSNRHNSRDTTQINPFGGHLEVNSFTYLSELDSMKIRLRDVSGSCSLRRFAGNNKLPLINFNLGIKRARMSQTEIAASFRNTRLDATVHLRERRKRDSNLSDEEREARRRHRREHHLREIAEIDSMGYDLVEVNVDNSIRSLIMRWNLEGSLTSERGRLKLQKLPIRNSFKHLDLKFTTDSIALKSLDYNMGRSDFSINGSIANIRRATAPRRPGEWRIDLEVNSDTINLNEIARAALTHDKEFDPEDPDLDNWVDGNEDIADDETVPDSVFKAVIIPINVNAGVRIGARNIIYSDLILKDLLAELLVYKGTVNLHDLSAQTGAGSVNVSAMYTAPTERDMSFAIGVNLKDFHLDKVKYIVPAVDSVIPMIRALSGNVNVNAALTSKLTPDMYLDMKSLKAALQFEGDSLVIFDNKTFKTIAKWMLFRHKNRNLIDSVRAEIVINDGIMNIYPFILNIDRYRFGVMGYNDLDMNLNYHISVLRSPIPWRFGINIKGTPEHLKIRLGGPKFKESMVARQDSVAIHTRINLLRAMNSTFRRGVRAAAMGDLDLSAARDTSYMHAPEPELTAEDSLGLFKEGVLEIADSATLQRFTMLANPDSIFESPSLHPDKAKRDKQKRDKQKRDKSKAKK